MQPRALQQLPKPMSGLGPGPRSKQSDGGRQMESMGKQRSKCKYRKTREPSGVTAVHCMLELEAQLLDCAGLAPALVTSLRRDVVLLHLPQRAAFLLRVAASWLEPLHKGTLGASEDKTEQCVVELSAWKV